MSVLLLATGITSVLPQCYWDYDCSINVLLGLQLLYYCATGIMSVPQLCYWD
jgi:hypothetical protein